MTQVTFEALQEALVDERITPEQFISVLIDNFGAEKTFKLIKPIMDEAWNDSTPQTKS